MKRYEMETLLEFACKLDDVYTFGDELREVLSTFILDDELCPHCKGEPTCLVDGHSYNACIFCSGTGLKK